MRHRIKKIPTLKHLLRSDKSTYVDKKVSSSSRPNFTFPRNTAFSRPVVTGASRLSLARGAADGFLGKVKLGSWNLVVPSCVSTALLLVLGMLIFPVGIVGSGEKVYAETINYPAGENNNTASISFTLNDNNIDGSIVSTEVKPDEISYISNNLKVTTSNIGKFAITIQSASDNGNLVNSDNGAIIAPITSSTIPANFANNTWGYALSDETSKADAELTYNPLPGFQETPTAQYNKEKPTDGDYNLKLVFAAKIGSNKPAGHYQTTALVSVVAEAKELVTPTTPLTDWNKLEYMQQMTSDACDSATEHQSKKLIDNRDTSKSYTVTKLKGNAGCWMTENMDYDGSLRMWYEDSYGGYYSWDNAKEVCNFAGWQLPTHTQYNTLLNAYSVSNNAAGSTILRSAPLSFLYGGHYNGGLTFANSYGYYWSSTPSNGNAYFLYFGSSSARLGDGNPTPVGYSVRCVAK